MDANLVNSIAPTRAPALLRALGVIGPDPRGTLLRIHALISSLVDRLSGLMEQSKAAAAAAVAADVSGAAPTVTSHPIHAAAPPPLLSSTSSSTTAGGGDNTAAHAAAGGGGQCNRNIQAEDSLELSLDDSLTSDGPLQLMSEAANSSNNRLLAGTLASPSPIGSAPTSPAKPPKSSSGGGGDVTTSAAAAASRTLQFHDSDLDRILRNQAQEQTEGCAPSTDASGTAPDTSDGDGDVMAALVEGEVAGGDAAETRPSPSATADTTRSASSFAVGPSPLPHSATGGSGASVEEEDENNAPTSHSQTGKKAHKGVNEVASTTVASDGPQGCGGESLWLLRARWEKLQHDFYSEKKGRFELSKIPDIYDQVRTFTSFQCTN